MDERFEDHLRHPRNRGASPSGAHDGAAGGAACGDLVRISLRVEEDRVAQATFDASGCGAAQAAASAAIELVDGAHVLDAARVGARAIAAELGGLSPASCTPRTSRPTRCTGRSARPSARDAAVPAREDRVLVAMSGGVDSAVAALLTVEDAGQVAAVTLELWADPANDAERSCCSAAAVRVARSLAHDMGLPHFTLDLREEFRAGVVEPWLAGHAAGVTPNPCVRCNGSVRLDAMVAFADRLGAASLATGHYARLRDGRLQLAEDRDKDQTYMLAATPPSTLARLRFPLGDLEKDEVRALAARAGLPVADKPDSQDLCFLAGTTRAAFLARHGAIEDRPGDLVDGDGVVVGRHRGQHHFTVGQRRGLGIATGEPRYVLGKDADRNTVTVGCARGPGDVRRPRAGSAPAGRAGGREAALPDAPGGVQREGRRGPARRARRRRRAGPDGRLPGGRRGRGTATIA